MKNASGVERFAHDNPFHAQSEEYLARIHSYYEFLSDSERRIGDFLLTNGHENNLKYNINDLARLTGTSTATVVRFCRSLGFSGFSEFKVYVSRGVLSPLGSNTHISAADSAAAIKQKVSDLSKLSIDSAMETLDNESLAKAIDIVSAADRIFICGDGGLGGLVQTVAGSFLNAGMDCFFLSDTSLQAKYISMLTPRDVVIGLTNRGYEKNVVDAQKLAVDAGVPTVSITSIRKSLATKYADVVLYSTQRDNWNPLDLITLTVGHLTVLHSLQTGCAVRNAEKNQKRILELHKQRALKNYALDVDEVKLERMRF